MENWIFGTGRLLYLSAARGLIMTKTSGSQCNATLPRNYVVSYLTREYLSDLGNLLSKWSFFGSHLKLGHCGGQAVSILAFFSEDSSANPAEAYISFSVKFAFKKNKKRPLGRSLNFCYCWSEVWIRSWTFSNDKNKAKKGTDKGLTIKTKIPNHEIKITINGQWVWLSW